MFHKIRFHGRGGQGTVSAAALMALATFELMPAAPTWTADAQKCF